MFQQVLDLFDADRLIAAMVLLDDVEDRALLDATSDLPGVRDEALEVKRRMQEPEMAAKLNLIRKRGRACEELLNDSVTVCMLMHPFFPLLWSSSSSLPLKERLQEANFGVLH